MEIRYMSQLGTFKLFLALKPRPAHHPAQPPLTRLLPGDALFFYLGRRKIFRTLACKFLVLFFFFLFFLLVLGDGRSNWVQPSFFISKFEKFFKSTTQFIFYCLSSFRIQKSPQLSRQSYQTPFSFFPSANPLS